MSIFPKKDPPQTDGVMVYTSPSLLVDHPEL